MIPQKVFAPKFPYMPSFDKPKSVNLQCPSESKTTLSGFKSRNIMSLLCKYSNPNKISHIDRKSVV